MNNRRSQPRYRFDKTVPQIPANETPEQRTKRLLASMPKSVDGNPKLMIEFLRRTNTTND